MVDFNNETTIGTPATEVEKISILQRRYDLIEAYEAYKKGRLGMVEANLSITRARLISLFLELQASLKRRLFKKAEGQTKNEYEKLKDSIFADKLNEEQLLKVIFRINEELDEMRLIRVDNQKVYDSTDVEEENKEKGY